MSFIHKWPKYQGYLGHGSGQEKPVKGEMRLDSYGGVSVFLVFVFDLMFIHSDTCFELINK